MSYKDADIDIMRHFRFAERGPLVLDCLKDRAFMEEECLNPTGEQFKSL